MLRKVFVTIVLGLGISLGSAALGVPVAPVQTAQAYTKSMKDIEGGGTYYADMSSIYKNGSYLNVMYTYVGPNGDSYTGTLYFYKDNGTLYYHFANEGTWKRCGIMANNDARHVGPLIYNEIPD